MTQATELRELASTLSLTSTGGVTIEASAGAARNLVVSDSATHSQIIIKASGTALLSQLGFGDADDDNVGQIIYDHSTDKMALQTGGGSTVDLNPGLVLSGRQIGINNENPGASISAITVGSTGGPNTIALELINNGTSYSANALAAYNAHTGYDIADKSSYTFHARGLHAGSIATYATGSTSEPVVTHRIARLTTGSVANPLMDETYFQYDGSGTSAGNANLPSGSTQVLKRMRPSGDDAGFLFSADASFYPYQTGSGAKNRLGLSSTPWKESYVEDYKSTTERSNVPTSLNLNFANTNILDSRLSFHRDSYATYYDRAGVIRVASPNQPRFDHDPETGESRGLIIERPQNNRLTTTTGFNVAWAHTAGTGNHQNAGLAPDGTWSASKLVGYNTSSTKHYVYRGSVSGDRTWSVYAKAAEHSRVYFWEGGVTAQNAGFDLTGDGAVFSSVPSNAATIKHVGNGWYRCTLSVSVSSGNPLLIIGIMPTTQTHYSTNWNGDGGGVLLWGAQEEPGTYATSYIPSSNGFRSRSTSKSYFNENGILSYASKNQKVIPYSMPYQKETFGLDSNPSVVRFTIETPPDNPVKSQYHQEAASTNQEDFSYNISSGNHGLAGSCEVTNETTAPDGTYTAGKFVFTNANDRLDDVHNTFSDGQYYTFSIWVKGPANTITASSILSNTGANVEPKYVLTGEWQKIVIVKKFLTSQGGTNVRTHGVINRGTPGQNTTASDGTVLPYASYVYVWGMQVELGVTDTSYIPSYGSTTTRTADSSVNVGVTRAQELMHMDLTEDWFNHDSGTVYSDIDMSDASESGIANSIWAFADDTDVGTTNAKIQFHTSSTAGRIWMRSDGVSQNADNNTGSKITLAACYDGTTVRTRYVDGSLTTKSFIDFNQGQDTTAKYLVFGDTVASGYEGCYHLKRFSYYPEAFTSNQLVSLVEE